MAPIFVMLIKALLPTAVEYIKQEVVEALDEQAAKETTKEPTSGSKTIRNRKAATR